MISALAPVGRRSRERLVMMTLPAAACIVFVLTVVGAVLVSLVLLLVEQVALVVLLRLLEVAAVEVLLDVFVGAFFFGQILVEDI